MKQFHLVTILFCIQTLVFAEGISTTEIQEQKDMQQACIERRMPECEEKCASNTDVANCHELCQLNISNECRYAGE